MARMVIRVDLAGTREQLRRRIIATAKREHAKIMAAEPKPDGFTRVVGGVRGVSEDQAEIGDGISYYYERLSGIARQALDTLREMSPVQSGAYRDGHMLLLNGVPVANLDGYKDGDEISITNILPYSRRLEIGKRKDGRPFVVQVPPRIYERAAKVLRGRFGNQTSIEYTFRAFIGGGQIDQGKTATRRFRHHNRPAVDAFHAALNGTHNDPDVRFPTLVFHPAGTAFGTRRHGR